MAKTYVENVVLTVTEVDVFVDTMKIIHEAGAWETAKSYLKSKGKQEMIIDAEAFGHLGVFFAEQGMLKKDSSGKDIGHHIRPHYRRLREFLEGLLEKFPPID